MRNTGDFCFSVSIAFELQQATKCFGDLKVFDLEEVTIRHGEVVAIVGPSGCGKSTLLSCLAGLEPLTSGVIRIDSANGEAAKRRIGMVFQRSSIFPWLRVRENLTVSGTSLRDRAAANIDEALEEFGLSDFSAAWPKQLSGGMLRRLELARATLRQPNALLLDEPFSALDPGTRSEMHSLVSRIQAKQGLTVVLVTHDPDEAVALADRVIVLSARPARVVSEIEISSPLTERGIFSISAARQEVRNRVLTSLRDVSNV